MFNSHEKKLQGGTLSTPPGELSYTTQVLRVMPYFPRLLQVAVLLNFVPLNKDLFSLSPTGQRNLENIYKVCTLSSLVKTGLVMSALTSHLDY